MDLFIIAQYYAVGKRIQFLHKYRIKKITPVL
jgi:hypothetical protein